MIAYVPEIYPGESVYSWICRIYCHSGYFAYRYLLHDLLGSSKSVDFDFIPVFTEESWELIKSQCEIKSLIMEHTLFKECCRFQSKDRVEKELHCLLTNSPHTLPSPKTKGRIRKLKYCPYCAEEDRELYGEAYWHIDWQLRGMRVCPKHGCELIETDVEIGQKKGLALCIAEFTIPSDHSSLVIKMGNQAEIGFAAYIKELFDLPMGDQAIPYADILWSKLCGTKYASSGGMKIYTSELFKDLDNFYSRFLFSEEGITEKHELSKLLFESQSNHLFICQLLYFMNIPAHTLTEPYEGKSRPRQHVKRNYDNRKGTVKQNWAELDLELLHQVELVCRNIYIRPDGKPGKVTVREVERILNLPYKRMTLLPKCSECIQSHFETYPDYWGRKLKWALERLVEEGYEPQTICWRRIRDLTNFKKSDFLAALDSDSFTPVDEMDVQFLKSLV